MTTKAPKSVLELIYDWSLSRPAWQRDALRRIILRGRLTDADIAELVLLCKKEKGDAAVTLTAQLLEKTDLPANPGAGESVALVSVADVSGVNQLAATQTLPFEPKGITIIYGDNGAGKSGYARVLKNVCRARYPGEIMPDAYETGASLKAQAKISYLAAGKPATPISWKNDGKPDPVLSAVSVFDRECGEVHLRNKNEVAFRPFGLDIPDDLADAVSRVKATLTAEQTKLEGGRDPVFLTPSWRAYTRAGAILSKLTARTAVDTLEKLANVLPAAKARHAQLCEDLAKDPMKASSEQLIYANQLRQVVLALREVGKDNSNEALHGLKAKAHDARTKRKAATIAADTTFKAAALPGVGGDVWRTLWEAAQHYHEHAAYKDKPFPATGDGSVCLLCHQELTPEARTRLGGFDAFVKADTERLAAEAEDELESLRAEFAAKSISGVRFGDVRKRIALGSPELAKSVLRFLASARLRHWVCLKGLNDESATLTLGALADDPVAQVLELETAARTYAEELCKAADAEGRKVLEKERDDIADCMSLAGLMPKVKAEIERLKGLALAASCLGDTVTTVITKLGNDIADDVITPRMRDQFHKEIVGLAADRVRVEIVRAGGKLGSPYYQVRLLANPKAPVDNVLSEGEQTCVALAAFLTELATAAHQSGLVFDDPVSSLDHHWRAQVASRLVAEADVRQVIVFTHDLVFLNDVKDAAREKGTKVKLMSLSRTPAGAGTVAEGLPWFAASVLDRVDKMEKDVRAAKVQYDTRDDEGYRLSVHRIYSNLRSTWEAAIEDVAFSGVINRHRDYVNTKNLRKATVLSETDCAAFQTGFDKCCDQTDAHNQSKIRNAAPPPPDEMMNDVKGVRAWADSIKDRQKAIK